jgi:putative hemolysin
MTTADLLRTILILVMAEAFFALSEIALISASRERLQSRAQAGSRSAAVAQRLLAQPERLLATTLIATNLTLVASSFAANEAAARLIGPERSWWAIAVLVPVILVFAEILPKFLARRYADSLALVVAIPVKATMFVLSPAVALAGGFSRAVTGRFKRPGTKQQYVTKEELKALVLAERSAELDPDEARLITRLLGMAGARIREVMTPLPDVVSVPGTASLSLVCETIRKHGFSRLPVFQDRTDNIIGVVHAMDLIMAPPEAGQFKQFVRKAYYVPESGKVDQLLEEFRKRGHELAVVVDEHGAAAGIVTMEDLLEEMVGEILDEFDRPVRDTFRVSGPGEYLAEGNVPVGEVSERLNLAIPRSGYETLAGFIAYRLQRIPKLKDSITHGRFKFTVVEATERRVKLVKIEEAGDESGGAPS